ncbi:PH domain-containing protein [Rummeliibacillus sp. JY-2-4R]
MSREVNHLHPITVVVSFFSSLKNFVIPLAFIFLGKGFHYTLNPDSKHFTETIISSCIILLIITILLIVSYINWKRFVYWFEEEELRIEYGFFVKKKRYIPFERIQSLNYKEGILHRPFKLVKVSIETAADSGGEAEANLIAITREQATMIEQEMKKAKRERGQTVTQNVAEDLLVEVDRDLKEREIPRSVIHRMSKKDLLVLATTSSGIGVVFSGIAAISSQFNDWIPYERLYGEFQAFMKFGLLIIIILSLIVLLIAWLLSVALTFLNNYGFIVEKEEDKLFISKGLLEKKRLTIPLKRIQGIRIIENPFRQLFGYATIVLESAGNSGEEDDQKIVLIPLVKKKQGLTILKNLFPEIQLEPSINGAPKRAMFRYMFKNVYWLAPITVIVSYFAFPYGLWSLLILPVALLIGLWQHHSAGYSLNNNQLMIIYRGISRNTFVTLKKRIQTMSLSQSYFAKRKDLATITVYIMSGSTGNNCKIQHFDLLEMEETFGWYEPNSLRRVKE